ncbi:MAG: hypothetical protein GC139_03620 [Sideroxydans sp.]|nr:hypothetical protein [Sideroxydans sp.]
MTLSVGDISAPSFAARGVTLSLPLDGSAELRLDELSVAGRHWRKVRVHCAGFVLSTARLECRQAKLNAAPDLPFDFSYDFGTQRLALELSAGKDERWRVDGDFHDAGWRVNVQLRNAQARRLATLLPPEQPLPTQGLLNGMLQIRGDQDGLRRVQGAVQAAELAFSDAAGLHAADKLAGSVQFDAVRSRSRWDWHGALDWQRGELFWQPLYLKGAHSLTAAGSWDGGQLQVAQAELNRLGVGRVELSALWDTAKNSLLACDLHGSDLQLAPLFADYLKPFLVDSVLGAATLSGRGDADWQYRDGTTQALNLTLRDASLEDGQRRFALRGVNGTIPWRAAAATQAAVSFDSGALWGVPLGSSQLQLAMHGLEFSTPTATLPVVDGSLTVHDFSLQRGDGGWRWNFSGQLAPVSMPALSRALGWPEMSGALSGTIPQVSYDGREMRVGGALLFRVFDGTVVMTKLALADPFGPTPLLTGNLDMRELDLGQLTRTFAFGSMEGRIDVSVQDMALVNWQPVQFEAKVASSPGSYRKRISQKAVQNISALGGAGAAAAIQRSYLSFLQDFGYNRIGLSCVLRNGVCAMDGVSRKNGGYVIVEGGGIPAITVMGYNRAVGWNELLERLKRVLQDNTQVVIQ